MHLRQLTTGLVLLSAAALDPVAARRDAPAPAATSGLRVVMDPATGEIVRQPSAAQIGRLGAPVVKARRSAAELETFELPHGARGVVLDGWADHAMRVERAADGSLRTVCALGDRHEESR